MSPSTRSRQSTSFYFHACFCYSQGIVSACMGVSRHRAGRPNSNIKTNKFIWGIQRITLDHSAFLCAEVWSKSRPFFTDNRIMSFWGFSVFQTQLLGSLPTSCATSVWPLDAPLDIPGIVTRGNKYWGLGDRLCQRTQFDVDFIFSVFTTGRRIEARMACYDSP